MLDGLLSLPLKNYYSELDRLALTLDQSQDYGFRKGSWKKLELYFLGHSLCLASINRFTLQDSA